METHVSIFLNKFTLGFGDLKNSFLEIISNNKKENIAYPQTTPLSMVFPPKFIKDKQLITINAKKKMGNKYKIIAHGELVLHKNNFIEGKGVVEKIITMVQLESKVDTIKINKDNMGKIFVKISLEEPYEEWYKKFKTKAGLSMNNLKNKKNLENKQFKSYKKINFGDNLSLLTVTKIDKNDENLKNINLEQFISINEIKKLKYLFDNNYQNILPHDLVNLKKLNQNLYNHYQQLDNNYKNISLNINNENNDIKLKAKQTWDMYKDNKKKLYKKRIEFKLKKQKIKNEIKSNKDEKNNLKNQIDILNYKNKKAINQIFGEKENENNNNKKIEEEKNDIKNMTDILNKLYSLGYNIDDEMNGQEKTILFNILSQNNNNNNQIKKEEKKEIKEEKNIKKEENKENKNNNENNEEKNDIDIEDEHLGEQIVALIERDVNDLYSRKLISKMKIDQINTITYSFATEKKEKKISFKIENNNLICSNGQSFSSWLISNFNF